MVKLYYGQSKGILSKHQWDLFNEFETLEDFNKFMKRAHNMNFKDIIAGSESTAYKKIMINFELSNAWIRVG